ncbi:MAG: twin-arginine translocase subunit TatC [bacterium]|nr:twin-arginine translocase subunit TatC [bacterium]
MATAIGEAPDEKRLSFIEHLEELRTRILLSLASILVTTIGAFFFSDKIIDLLIFPCRSSIKETVFLSLLEPFNIRLKVAVGAGIIVASPFILYQLWRFIAPALKPKEKNVIRVLFWFAVLAFLAGVAFAYFVVLPIGAHFLLQYATPAMQPMIRIGEYISFVVIFLVAMGVVFETPLVLIGLNRIGFVSSIQLGNYRRFAVLGAVIVACAITPGSELLNSLIITIPLYLLYELSIWLIKLLEKRD